MVRQGIEFFRVGIVKASHVARKFNNRALHAKADTKEGNVVFTRIANGGNLAFHATVAKAAGHENTVTALEGFCAVAFVHIFRVDVAQLNLNAVGNATVNEGLVQTLVRFLEVNVLAHNGNGNLALGVGTVAHQLFPCFKVGIARGQAQHYGHFLVKAFLIELERNFVNIVHIHRRKHGVLIHIAEQGNLAAQFFRNALLTAAQNNIGLDTDREQLFNAVLGGLGFVLARAAQVGNQREVNVEAVVTAKLRLELANGLKEGQAFNIAHGTADFDDRNVGRVFSFRKGEHHGFDLVGDVRNNLHGAAQIVAATFLGDNMVVNGTRSGVVLARHGHVEVALVVPKVQIRFRAVVGNEYLAVLERVHGAGVNIDVRIKLLNGYS